MLAVPHRPLQFSALLMAVVAAISPFSAVGEDFIPLHHRYPVHDLDLQDSIRVVSTSKAAALEKSIIDVARRVSESVVAFGTVEGDFSATGVIIDPSGIVLTCSHHNLAPQTPIRIRMGGKREVRGTVLGRFKLDGDRPSPDLGVLKIDAPGPWPSVKIGVDRTAKAGETCLTIGYPGTWSADRPPLVRAGRILPHFPGWDVIRSTTSIESGDSGGPLVGLDGQLLGIAFSTAFHESHHAPLDGYFQHRDELLKGKLVSHPIGLFASNLRESGISGVCQAAPDLADRFHQSRLCTVSVWSDSRQVACGLIIHPDGRVVTKYSQVVGQERLICRFVYSTSFQPLMRCGARIVATDVANDLAILKLDAKGPFPQPVWLEDDAQVVPGMLVNNPVCSASGLCCVSASPVSEPSHGIPQIPVAFHVGPNDEPIVDEFNESHSMPHLDPFRHLVRKGDAILSVNGTPCQTAAHCERLLIALQYVVDRKSGRVNWQQAAEGSFCGELVELKLKRAGETVRAAFPKAVELRRSPTDFELRPTSLRSDSFPEVFAHDGRLRPEECGGPVVNLQGQVAGLNIARADPVRTLAIPAQRLRTMMAPLLRSPTEDDTAISNR